MSPDLEWKDFHLLTDFSLCYFTLERLSSLLDLASNPDSASLISPSLPAIRIRVSERTRLYLRYDPDRLTERIMCHCACPRFVRLHSISPTQYNDRTSLSPRNTSSLFFTFPARPRHDSPLRILGGMFNLFCSPGRYELRSAPSVRSFSCVNTTRSLQQNKTKNTLPFPRPCRHAILTAHGLGAIILLELNSTSR
jgi:hypothetical protein